jgi:hypothetical protein
MVTELDEGTRYSVSRRLTVHREEAVRTWRWSGRAERGHSESSTAGAALLSEHIWSARREPVAVYPGMDKVAIPPRL